MKWKTEVTYTHFLDHSRFFKIRISNSAGFGYHDKRIWRCFPFFHNTNRRNYWNIARVRNYIMEYFSFVFGLQFLSSHFIIREFVQTDISVKTWYITSISGPLRSFHLCRAGLAYTLDMDFRNPCHLYETQHNVMFHGVYGSSRTFFAFFMLIPCFNTNPIRL